MADSIYTDSAAADVIGQFYRCPSGLLPPLAANRGTGQSGYFRFGEQITCYGRSVMGSKTKIADDLPNAAAHICTHGHTVQLPFDPVEVLQNLWHERYAVNGYPGRRPLLSSAVVRNAYYRVRPLLPVPVRKYAQQLFHRNWHNLRFPAWPLDTSVEDLLERLLVLSMKAGNIDELPFIWFWPDGARSCVVLTHDIETARGAEYVPALMDLDESYGFKASFQIIPEKQYRVRNELLDAVRARGFEVNVQDLTHDGNIFDSHPRFLLRANAINRHLANLRASGFRAGRMFRNAEWYEALDILYDMSIPNVAHLDPQRGGCCTVFPFFIGNVLELPLTTTQDYTLFHILGCYTIALWREQLSLIVRRHGLATVLVHPDYLLRYKERSVYEQLLRYLAALRDEHHMWAPLPGDVNCWWRERAGMTLTREKGKWTVSGPGSERARIAWARASGDRIEYAIS